MSKRLVVLDVVGLTPRLLAHMPRLAAVAEAGFSAELGTVLPAVTCSVQATFLTGERPAGHGIVGNGWYFRDLGEVLLWRQHHGLVGGEKLWQTARRVEPDPFARLRPGQGPEPLEVRPAREDRGRTETPRQSRAPALGAEQRPRDRGRQIQTTGEAARPF